MAVSKPKFAIKAHGKPIAEIILRTGLFFVLSRLVAKVDGCFVIDKQTSLSYAKCGLNVDEMTSDFVGS